MDAAVYGQTGRERTDRNPPEDEFWFMTTPEKSPAPAFELVDPFGRGIEYLRVSVTDRCDFRCVYCMSEHMSFLPKQDLLTLEELDQWIRRKLRAILWRQWKRNWTRAKQLIRRGLAPERA